MELSRRFRVLEQTLSMHTALRDRHGRRALIVDLLLLASSVVFCASAFAGDDALSRLDHTPGEVRYLLRIFSVLAFMLSVLSLRVDWKGKSARNGDAAEKMSRAIASFRRHRGADGTWPPECSAELDAVYWGAMQNSVPIPEAAFVELKCRHLKKIELSKMLDSNPGCPVFVLRLILLWSALRHTQGRTR